jgi:hypothetical protein
MKFWAANEIGQQIGKFVAVGDRLEQLLAHFRLTRQLLRIGIHHLWPLPEGYFFVVIRKRAFRLHPESGRAELVFRFPRGNKPAHNGVCVMEDGTILMGEYVINSDRRHPIALHRSLDGGRSFQTAHTFSPGEVKHIHFVQWDPFAKCVWMGTGDSDAECRLYCSNDRGDSWKFVGGGTQLWRAVGVTFSADALYWGTDAGSDAGDHPNYIMQLDRKAKTLSRLLEIQGPAHGIGTLRNGTIAVSTGVEGGANEKDNSAHLWVRSHGSTWHEAASFKKDSFPFVVQYGVLRFPKGTEKCCDLVFTGMGLVGAGETGMFTRLHEYP